MKLIIDIDIVNYNVCRIGGEDFGPVQQAVGKGIPLEDIKTEIINIPITDTDGHNNNWYREPQAIIDDVLQIIDKHIGGKENEE